MLPMFDSNLKTYSISWLEERFNNDNLNTEISIQRQAVWNHLYQSNLIMSILHYVPIPSLWFEKKKSGRNNYNVIDGKQRTLTICSFLNDQFPLSNKMQFKTIEGDDITGLTCSELFAKHEYLWHRLKDYQLSIAVIDPMTAEQREFLFFMGNQSVPLGTTNFLPVILGEFYMQQFVSACRHSLFTNTIKMTKTALNRRIDLKLLIQYLILKHRGGSGLGGAEVLNFANQIRSGETTISFVELKELMDYLYMGLKKGNYLKAVNIPVVMSVGQRAMELNVDAKTFGEKVEHFFMEVEAGSNIDYTEAGLKGGSSKKANVQARLDNLMKILGEDSRGQLILPAGR